MIQRFRLHIELTGSARYPVKLFGILTGCHLSTSYRKDDYISGIFANMRI